MNNHIIFVITVLITWFVAILIYPTLPGEISMFYLGIITGYFIRPMFNRNKLA
jgi:hypothetical protein